MKIQKYSANDLFKLFQNDQNEIVILDVRNQSALDDFTITCSAFYDYLNVPYVDFLDQEDKSVSRIPKGKKIIAVCDKTSASKYISELLALRGFTNTGYLDGGINDWKSLSICLPIETKENYIICQFLSPDNLRCSYGLLSGSELFLFDPAGNYDFYLDFITKNNIKNFKIFLTHNDPNILWVSKKLSEITGAVIVGNHEIFDTWMGRHVDAENNDIWYMSADAPTTRVLDIKAGGFSHTFYLIDGKYLITGSLKNNGNKTFENMTELYGYLSDLSEL